MTHQFDWSLAANFTPLQSGSLHLWLKPLAATAAETAKYKAVLDEEETSHCERLLYDIHRQRYIVAHGFTRMILSRYTQCSSNQLRFAKGQYGKPSLVDFPALQFNLSHSQDLAILAITNDPVGVDIEYMDRNCDWQGIMKRFYTATETTKLMSLPAESQRRAFFQVWTRKEAHMKVTGQGLYLAPGQFTVSVPPEPAALLQQTVGGDVQQWQMLDIKLPSTATQYCACVSVAGKVSRVNAFISS